MDFMITMMVGFSIGCTLSEQQNSYQVFTTAFKAYAAPSHLCFISQSFLLFLSGHTSLGFAGSLTVPLGQEVLQNLRRFKLLGLLMGGLRTITLFNPALPTGGWFADEANWRYLFYLNILTSLIVTGFTSFLRLSVYRNFTIGVICLLVGFLSIQRLSSLIIN
jgi:DHA2 family multidrug resistance protein